MTHAARRIAAAAALALAVAAAAPRALAEGGEGGGGAGPAPAPAPASEAESLFFKAWYQEHALRDFDAAARAWDDAAGAARRAGRIDLLGRSLAGRARTLRALGRAEDATAAAREARAAAPDEPEVVALAVAPTGASAEEDDLAVRIAVLVGRLMGDDDSVANAARNTFAVLGDAAVPALARELRSADPTKVRAVAGALGRIGTDLALEALRDAAADPAVRFPGRLLDLGEWWGVRKDDGRLVPLLETLWDREGGRHRPEVARALRHQFRLSASDDAAVRRFLVRAVGEVEPVTALGFLLNGFPPATAAAIEPFLARCLGSDDASVQESLVRVLVGDHRGRDAARFARLLPLLASPHRPVRDALFEALDQPGGLPEEILDRLAGAALRDPGYQAKALGQLTRPGSVASTETLAALAALVSGEVPSTAANAGRAVDLLSGRPDFRTPAVIEALRRRVAHPDRTVREPAYKVAASPSRWEPAELDPVVAAMLLDPDASVHQRGLQALPHLWNRLAPPSASHAAFRELVARHAEGRSVGQGGPPSLRDWVSSAQDGSWPGVPREFVLELLALAEGFAPGAHARLLDGNWQFVAPARDGEDGVAVMRMAAGRLRTAAARQGWAYRVMGIREDLLRAAVADADPAIRDAGYARLSATDGNGQPVVKPSGDLDLPHLAEDLEKRFTPAMFTVAFRHPRPSLAKAARALRVRGVIEIEPAALLLLLARCDPQGSLEEVASGLPTIEPAAATFRDLVAHLEKHGTPEATAAALKAAMEARPGVGGEGILVQGRGGTRTRIVLVAPATLSLVLHTVDPAALGGAVLQACVPALPPQERGPVLLRVLRDPSSPAATAAAELAGAMNLEGAWEYLRALLDVPDADLAAAARKALESLASARRFRAALEDGTALGGDALDRARELLRSKDARQRRAAVLALAALGDRAAVGELLRAATDEDATVRDAAMAALERLAGTGTPPEETPLPAPVPAKGEGGDGK